MVSLEVSYEDVESGIFNYSIQLSKYLTIFYHRKEYKMWLDMPGSKRRRNALKIMLLVKAEKLEGS